MTSPKWFISLLVLISAIQAQADGLNTNIMNNSEIDSGRVPVTSISLPSYEEEKADGGKAALQAPPKSQLLDFKSETGSGTFNNSGSSGSGPAKSAGSAAQAAKGSSNYGTTSTQALTPQEMADQASGQKDEAERAAAVVAANKEAARILAAQQAEATRQAAAAEAAALADAKRLIGR